MSVSPETSSKKWNVDRGVFLPLMLKITFSLGTSSENGQGHGIPSGPARQTRPHFVGDILKNMRSSQHRFDIFLEVFEDDETRAAKGPQDGSESALKTAENDDFARDILKTSAITRSSS